MKIRIAPQWSLLLLLTSPLGFAAGPSQARTADSQSMARVARERPKGEAFRLDLRQESHYRAVINRLRASGKTPENAPELFARLKRAHTRPQAATVESQQVGISSIDDTEWCGHLLPLQKQGNTTAVNMSAKTLGTCRNGADYVYTDVVVYETTDDGSLFQQVASNYYEEYAGGKYFDSGTASHTLTIGSGRKLYIDSYVLAFNDATGAESSTFLGQEVANAAAPESISLNHPRELIGNVYPTDNPIRVCLERGATAGNLDCDYASGRMQNGVFSLYTASGTAPTGVAAVDPVESASTTPNKWKVSNYYWAADPSYNTANLYLPLDGTFNAGSTATGQCTIHSHLSAKASVLLTEAGGRCQARMPVGTTVAALGFPLQPGPSGNFSTLLNLGPTCLGQHQNVALALDIAVLADCGKKDASGARVLEERHASLLNAPAIDFKFSCLAEGTHVLMADGSTLPVEKVEVGERVLTNDAGRALTVTSVSRGGESRPLVLLKDGQGREVRITSRHPLLTADGRVVAAEALVAGDKVQARGGVVTLAAVERVPAQGQVYNVTLGTEAELATVGPQERTLFAGGFLVGDGSMQAELSKPKPETRPLLARLPKAWHKDYLRSPSRTAGK
jgi:hypothetical protein